MMSIARHIGWVHQELKWISGRIPRQIIGLEQMRESEFHVSRFAERGLLMSVACAGSSRTLTVSHLETVVNCFSMG